MSAVTQMQFCIVDVDDLDVTVRREQSDFDGAWREFVEIRDKGSVLFISGAPGITRDLLSALERSLKRADYELMEAEAAKEAE